MRKEINIRSGSSSKMLNKKSPSSGFGQIDKVTLSILTFTPGDCIEQSLGYLKNTPLGNFKIYSLGKEAWFEDANYEASPYEYELHFHDVVFTNITQEEILKTTLKLPPTVQLKSIRIRRK